jgi:DNA-binding CsgD family transcriptional regulator
LKKILLIVTLFLLLPSIGFAEWTNLIHNYSRSDYKAGSQNWQIIQLDNYWMYFANKMGLLEYNGKDWHLYPLNGNTDTRCIYYSRKDQRVYVGGINELGYLELSDGGKRQYRMIGDLNALQELNIGNIWSIYEIDDAIYFCGDQMVVKWVNDHFSIINAPGKIDCSQVINNTLHIGTEAGVYVLAGGSFFRLSHADRLKDQKIRAILPLGNEILIATARNGLFLYSERSGLKSFHTDADAFIRENELFSVAAQKDRIALGTVMKGVVLITSHGKFVKYINESHGLQNNTVLASYFDRNGNLWLGLDNGIDYIALNYPVTYLYSTAKFYGAGYAACLYRNKLYLGTNRGLYVCDWPVPNTESAPELQFVAGTQGQVWGLDIVDGQLLMCHDRGLFAIDADGVSDLRLSTGAWGLLRLKGSENKFWLSTYRGFCVMQKKSDILWDIQLIDSIHGSIINFEEDRHNRLFLRANRRQLACISLNVEQNRVEKEIHYGPDHLPEDYSIHELSGRIVLCSPSGFYTCNVGDQLVPDTILNRTFGTIAPFKTITQQDDVTWVLGDQVVAAQYDSGPPLVCHHNIPLSTNFERIYPLNDSLAIIPNENGFALWNTRAGMQKPDYPLQIVEVAIMKDDQSKGETLFPDAKEIPEIPYHRNSLWIRYHLINYTHPSTALFHTRLDNGEWSDYSADDSRLLSHIPIGSHVFRVATLLAGGQTIEDSFAFTILPPWYLTAWAYSGYLLLLTGLAFLVWKLDDSRIKRKEAQMEMRQHKNIEVKEEEIMRLKNEQLEVDIRHKSQELANSAIHLARKNEILIELKEDLLRLFGKTGFPDAVTMKRTLLELNAKIDDNIHEDDSLHKFEENFDLVHNNFISRLAGQYPSLSMTERKMCAYIKMQLSSKEIAPLLNISIRGVETTRYRLRKKLRLSRDESLTQFLINF